MASSTRSQLVLRSSATQLVVGTPLHPDALFEVVSGTLQRYIGQPRTEVLWGELCAEVVRQSAPDEPLTLSIPTRSDAPGVWVSEIEPRRFSVAATIRGTHHWDIVTLGHELTTSSTAA